MPQKLAFTVACCSGEDPDFPASELLFHSHDSKGWCTPRFSQYPQDLTLRLEAPARLAQIQLLSHEFKIAAKVELLVGTFDGATGAAAGLAAPGAPLPPASADPAKAAWRRLGFLSFDTNEKSSYSARELKSVALNGTPAHLLRLVFHRCHANAANIYGQVSLVAISILGDPLVPAPLSPITNTGGPGYGPQPQLASPVPLALGMGGMPAPQPQPPYLQLAGQQPYLQPPALGPQQQQQQYAQPAAVSQQQFAVPAAGLQPGLDAAPSAPLGAPPTKEESAAALAAEIGVDVLTAQRIQDLTLQKQQAVEREDYDEAKRLKVAVDRLRAAGGAIAELEARKRAAVEEEDYDLAKQLKLEVDRMRAAAYASALDGNGGGLQAPLSQPASRRASVVASAASPAGAGRPSGDGAAAQPGSEALPAAADFASPAAQRQAAAPSPSGRLDWHSYDERPAQAKGAYSFQHADETSLPTTHRSSGQQGPRALQSRGGGSDAGPAPPGFPADLPPPDAFSAADAKDAGPLVDLVGEYLARCAYSKAWQLREAALARVAADLEGGTLSLTGRSDALKALSRGLLLRCLKDKVPAVVSAALRTLRALAAAAADGASPRDLQSALSDLLPVLVEKAADLNQRTREQTTEALVALSGVPAAGLAGSTGAFLRAVKPNTAWKVVLGRLQLVSALLPVLGIAGRAGEGFSPEAVMDFANPALSNSSAEVRSAAVALLLQLAQAAGPSVQRMLPADLNAKVREQIQQGLLNGPAAAVAAPAAAPAPAKAAAPPRGAAPAAASAVRQPAGGKQPQQAAPAAAAAAPAPSPHQPAGGAAAAAAAPTLQQQQQQPLAPPGPDADPAPYEAEVRAREAQLGPAHPDVAEAICNLAILHNQRGNIAAALPLYERALAIWEAASGPDSPDVAHTLTDIAVIHLEQGRDDIGRPLLERALRIQEAHLGPDHPDVMAIRDVLDEEA
ncbi:hypothetical protein ABPG75_003922 [Micractinium tetrahymenae]